MHINDVCGMLGLSRKSIRYYEDMNLITPSRNKNNDYRIYTDEDIKKLKLIKFLRELNVPIKEIKDLFNRDISLTDCMKREIDRINLEEDKYKDIKEMCEEIINSNDDISSIDVSKYFQGIRILNKEGFTMRDVKKNNKQKIIGACISSLLFILFFGFILVMITIGFINSEMPVFAYILCLFLFGSPLFGVVYNLISRIKEILGGEEDEASKY